MSLRILCVDDEINQTKFISKTLKNEGFIIDIAHDGEEALNKIQTSIKNNRCLIDLMLLDINMPKMNGFEVVEKLKSNSITKNLPIIFISSSLDSNVTDEALNLGVTDFIYKPFKSAEISSRINKIQKHNTTSELDVYYLNNLSNSSLILNNEISNEFTKVKEYLDISMQSEIKIDDKIKIQNRILEEILISTNDACSINSKHQEVYINEIIRKSISKFNLKNNYNVDLKINSNEIQINYNSGLINAIFNYIYNIFPIISSNSKIDIDIFIIDNMINLEFYISSKNKFNILKYLKSPEYILLLDIVKSIDGNTELKKSIANLNLLKVNLPIQLFKN